MLVNSELLAGLSIVVMYGSILLLGIGIAEDIVSEYRDNQERNK